MPTASQRTKPLGLFQDKHTPWLYDHLIGVLRVRHDSRRTEEAYVHWVRRYIDFPRRQHPRRLAKSDVNRFLTHLAVQEHVAASTQNPALSAILFLYKGVLEQPLDRMEGVVRARRPNASAHANSLSPEAFIQVNRSRLARPADTRRVAVDLPRKAISNEWP